MNKTHATAQDYIDRVPQLEQLYSFRDSQVGPFLEQHPFLVPIVVEAHKKIGEYFSNAPLVLEVYVDPEIAGEVQLVLYILTDKSPEEAVKRLNQFSEDWWLDAMLLADGKMTITLDAI